MDVNTGATLKTIKDLTEICKIRDLAHHVEVVDGSSPFKFELEGNEANVLELIRSAKNRYGIPRGIVINYCEKEPKAEYGESDLYELYAIWDRTKWAEIDNRKVPSMEDEENPEEN